MSHKSKNIEYNIVYRLLLLGSSTSQERDRVQTGTSGDRSATARMSNTQGIGRPTRRRDAVTVPPPCSFIVDKLEPDRLLPCEACTLFDLMDHYIPENVDICDYESITNTHSGSNRRGRVRLWFLDRPNVNISPPPSPPPTP